VQLRTNVPITLLHLSLGCRRGLGGFGAGASVVGTDAGIFN